MTKMIRFFFNLVLGNEPHVMCNLGNDKGAYPEAELTSLLKQGVHLCSHFMVGIAEGSH